MKKWSETLPDELKEAIIKGLEQSNANQTIPHNEAMKPYLKWLKKSDTLPPGLNPK